jgi:glycosyltransferase involved in cell wall biosynthesis
MIASTLSRVGNEVSACYIGDKEDPEFRSYPQRISTGARGLWPRQWVIGKKWSPVLRRVLSDNKPDVVITQQIVAASTTETCNELGVPVIVILNSVDQFCLGSFWSGHPWKCAYFCPGCKDSGPRIAQYLFFLSEVRRMHKGLRAADSVVTNSRFMQSTLKEIWGIDSFVVTPIVATPARAKGPRRDGVILFFSPVEHKGLCLVLELARRMQSEKFLFVGEAKQKSRQAMASLKNVEYVPWTSDVEPLYEQARIVIMPSVIPEGFGRVCIEAMSRGIPCVASAVGALPETVGPGGDIIKDHKDVESWVAAVQRYSDVDYLTEKSRVALLHSKVFLRSDGTEKLSSHLSSLVGNPGKPEVLR